MAHGHDFVFRLVVLKTSEGYLTKTGFTHDITSPDMGDLTMNMGMLSMDKECRLGINIRYPNNMCFDEFIELYTKEIHLPFTCNLRFDIVTEAEKLKELYNLD